MIIMVFSDIKNTNRKITNRLYKYVLMLLLYGSLMQVSALAQQLPDTNTGHLKSSASGRGIMLPLKLIEFGGRPSKDIVQLLWTTAAEKNVNHFELEKSNDGTNFVFINKQTAKGIAASSVAYQAEDFKPSSGINYYRLKIVCNDGKVAYSKVILVKHR